jgi:hypothetical protein
MDCVLPLHPVYPHEQSMPRVLSIAAHSTLWYLPDDATHEQTGWAHFLAFAGTISLLSTSDQERMIPAQMLITRKKRFCTERNTM